MAKNAEDRRKAAREKARQIAQQQAKREKTAKTVLFVGIAVVVVAVVAVVSVLIYQSSRPAVGPSTYAGDSITIAKIGDGVGAVALPDTPEDELSDNLPAYDSADLSAERVPNVDVYMDFQCPLCKTFDETNAQALNSLTESGDITVTYHPVSILDSFSGGNEYSTRAANAVACVADSGQDNLFPGLLAAMFAGQPAEGGGGMEDAQLIEMIAGAGVDMEANTAPNEDGATESVQSCIENRSFDQFVEKSTQNALSSGMTGTPWVKIDGEEVDSTKWGDAAIFGQLLLEKTGQISAGES